MVKNEMLVRPSLNTGWMERLSDELAQAWAIAIKDVKAYYLSPTTVLWAFLMPLAMWSCFVIRQNLAPEAGLSRLLGIVAFFSTSSVGPVIILLERRMHTYDRLLVAPMSLLTVIIGKSLVGMLFGLIVCIFPIDIGTDGFPNGVCQFCPADTRADPFCGCILRVRYVVCLRLSPDAMPGADPNHAAAFPPTLHQRYFYPPGADGAVDAHPVLFLSAYLCTRSVKPRSGWHRACWQRVLSGRKGFSSVKLLARIWRVV